MNTIKIKLRSINFIIAIMIGVLLYSCSEDFLEKEPVDAFSVEGFFNNSNDLKSYVNAFYDNTIFLRIMNNSRVMGNDNGTDDLISGGPSGRLNTRGVSGVAPTGTGWGGQYAFIRSINVFLENTYRVARGGDSRQFTGEAYYARAVAYSNLLNTYGGVPIILKALNVDDPELYQVRSSRNELARQIMVDLDSAIVNLGVNAEKGRVNKKTALHFKTRMGLFEGSWEHYHGAKSTPFAVSGSTGTEFLQDAVEAAEMLIDLQGGTIYTGTFTDMFQIKDPTSIPGVFWSRTFSQSGSFTHNIYGQFNAGGPLCATKQLVDQFLMRDGLPEDISTITNDDTSLRALGVNKDPRLSETIWTRPVDDNGGNITFIQTYRPDLFPEGSESAYSSSYPGFNLNQQRNPITSGYRLVKGRLLDGKEFRNGETGDIIYRYAETLLNYAESKAILGTLTQNDLDISVNLLRTRAGMPAMNLGQINGWGTTYSAQDGYEVGAPNILNEIRRERRIELALEGFRYDDMRRWAKLDDMINGFKPQGAHVQEFLDYWNSVTTELVDDEWDQGPISGVVLTLGVEVDVDATGEYFNPFFNNADFGNAGAGGFINPQRDYLTPIGSAEINLYNEKGSVTLEQNPGWINN